MRKPPTKTEPPTPVADGYISLTNAAAYMGISTRTLQQFVAAGQIECVRIQPRTGSTNSRLTRFTKAALDRFMRDHTIAPGKKR
jgi:excisionase family DNA binding protein